MVKVDLLKWPGRLRGPIFLLCFVAFSRVDWGKGVGSPEQHREMLNVVFFVLPREGQSQDQPISEPSLRQRDFGNIACEACRESLHFLDLKSSQWGGRMPKAQTNTVKLEVYIIWIL